MITTQINSLFPDYCAKVANILAAKHPQSYSESSWMFFISADPAIADHCIDECKPAEECAGLYWSACNN